MPSVLSTNTLRILDHPDYEYIKGPFESLRFRRELDRIEQWEHPIAVDTETTGLDCYRHRVRLIQLGLPDRALIIDLDGFRVDGERLVDWDQPELRRLKELLEGQKVKLLQNASFDLNFLRCEGVVLGGYIFDTMVASALFTNGLSQSRNDLGTLVKRKLDYELPKELQRADWSGEVSCEMLDYAARDVIVLQYLCQLQTIELKRQLIRPGVSLLNLFELEMRVLRPIAYMQYYGFGFDLDAAQNLLIELQTEENALKTLFLENLDADIKRRHPKKTDIHLPRLPDGSVNTREKDSGSVRLGTKVYKGFNPRSTQQMAAAFKHAGVQLKPDENGKPCLDQNLLAFIRKQYTLIDEYLNWKAAATRVTDIQKLIESVGPDGRIHCSYRQMGTETGRLSCAGPNLQQVNRSSAFRSKFVASPGHLLVVADFSQVELRVAAELSGEQRMIDAYKAGRDLHTETAALIKGCSHEEVTKKDRTSAKISNFGLLYGAGAPTLRKQAVAQYGIDMALDEARALVAGFREAYPDLYSWQQKQGGDDTESVFTLTGRRRRLTGFNRKYTTRINTVVQGSAGDITKLAIGKIWECICQAPKNSARLIACVHDELVLEVVEYHADYWMEQLKEAMEEAGGEVCATVPIVAEVASGSTWADAK